MKTSSNKILSNPQSTVLWQVPMDQWEATLIEWTHSTSTNRNNSIRHLFVKWVKKRTVAQLAIAAISLTVNLALIQSQLCYREELLLTEGCPASVGILSLATLAEVAVTMSRLIDLFLSEEHQIISLRSSSWTMTLSMKTKRRPRKALRFLAILRLTEIESAVRTVLTQIFSCLLLLTTIALIAVTAPHHRIIYNTQEDLATSKSKVSKSS